MTISTSDYIYPNICNNITCNYEQAINDRTTKYFVTTSNGTNLLQSNIIHLRPSNVCTLDGLHLCNIIGTCWCDPEGLSTRICYNHTSGGEGQLTLRCSIPGENKVTLATIAGSFISFTILLT